MKKAILFLSIAVFLIPVFVIAADGEGDGLITGANKLYGQARAWWERGLGVKFDQYFGSWWRQIEAFFRQRIAIFLQELPREIIEMKESIGKYIPAIKGDLWKKLLEFINQLGG